MGKLKQNIWKVTILVTDEFDPEAAYPWPWDEEEIKKHLEISTQGHFFKDLEISKVELWDEKTGETT